MSHTVSSTKPMMETLIEHKLIAAATLIIRELDSDNKLSRKAKKKLVDLHTKLSSTSKIFEDEDEEEEVSGIEKQIDSIKNKIMIWTYEPDEVKEYLKEVEGLRRLVESLQSLNPCNESKEHRILTKGNDVLRTSIHRIQRLFERTLVHNRYNFVPTRVRSSQDDEVGKRQDVYIMHLIDPEAIPDLKSIASLMFGTNYGRECVDSFISVRKDALDDLLFILEIERSSVEDVLKMERVALSSKIKRWTKAMRIFVRIYLASEKFLCEQIFGQGESVSALYFSESSKASILQFLNFAEALAVGHHESERIFMVLDVHDTLSDLTPDIKSSYPHENGSYLRTKFRDVLSRVGDHARAEFFEFTNSVRSNVSNLAFPKGGIYPLARFVMNYVTALVAYSNSLNTIFADHGETNDQDAASGDDNVNEISSSSPMGLHFRSLMSILESNLEEKSRLYKEDALGPLFLMNNVHYMAKKVKGSKLRTILGADWIRKHNRKFQYYAMSYTRSTWSPILKLVTEKGLNHSDSSVPPSKSSLLKKRLGMFYTAFEEIYKSQTGWLIPDNQLREDLRISISVKVCQDYRHFVNRFRNHISKKLIKYSADDLDNYLLDLFEGSPKSL
ncbi:hypothetical protein OSB04_000443 [Centaurea solstitialis]|uniref:Exocyst subunit Exo70 family protein n=1 Tax=Centaurea solstitialis TaxID=347529 RepID=A0AA38U7E6_9ASTR|nr:hypothetical protein OSB04_000443 [Centaurea solstitialis]